MLRNRSRALYRRPIAKAPMPSARRTSGFPPKERNEEAMIKRLYLFAVVLPVMLFDGVSGAQYPPYGQYPLLDDVANRVIQKYQNSSCEQLWQQRGQPPSQREQEGIQFLRNNPQMRAAFIDRVAAPIANKMFECGLLP